MKKEKGIDQIARIAVRSVLTIGIGAFLLALVLNFQLVMGVLTAFLIIGMLGASSKFM